MRKILNISVMVVLGLSCGFLNSCKTLDDAVEQAVNDINRGLSDAIFGGHPDQVISGFRDDGYLRGFDVFPEWRKIDKTNLECISACLGGKHEFVRLSRRGIGPRHPSLFVLRNSNI
jgi:hypothetical protein